MVLILQIAVSQFTMLIAVGGILLWSVWARRNPQHRLYAVPPISWMVNVVSFYVVALGSRALGISLPIDLLSSWIVLLLLHATFLIIGIGVILLWEVMVIKGHGGDA